MQRRHLLKATIQRVWNDINFTTVFNAFLNNFPALCVTSLSAKSSIPLKGEVFDLLVIDEASQCDIASALPLIYRSKRIAVIGDPYQLKHITSVNDGESQYLKDQLKLDYKYSYAKHSLFDYIQSLSLNSELDNIYLLNEHYRSHSKIINFSNQTVYLPNGCEIFIKTNDALFPTAQKGILWKNVIGTVPLHNNSNSQEIFKCKELATKLSQQYPNLSIGVCSPFKHQSEALKNEINGLSNVTVATIETFQGDERDIIVLSLVVNPNCRSGLLWYLNRESFLLNVAVTRAKSTLYVVGNFDFCKSNRDAYGNATMIAKLAKYIEQNGIVN